MFVTTRPSLPSGVDGLDLSPIHMNLGARAPVGAGCVPLQAVGPEVMCAWHLTLKEAGSMFPCYNDTTGDGASLCVINEQVMVG